MVLGAAGRCGRGIARELAARSIAPIAVSRTGAQVEGARAVQAADVEAMGALIEEERPAVVVNTIGPFVTTALPITRACIAAGAHYVDLSNELRSVLDVLALDAGASCLVPGAGYGFAGTECLVRLLCEGREPAARVRVDSLPHISEGGTVGEALAGSLVDSIAAGGRKYAGGQLVRASFGGSAIELTLPDGTRRKTTSVPTGDLDGARRASGAPDVIAASSEVPSTALSRVMMPVVSSLLSRRGIRDWSVRKLAAMKIPEPKPENARPTWSHARVEWADGTVREGWLRTEDAMRFTVKSIVEVAARLARGEGKPGAHTACGLFGWELAEAAGAELTPLRSA